MFGRPSKTDKLYERMILILADQVDWHRNASGLPMLSRGVPAQAPATYNGDLPKGQMSAAQAEKMYLSEDEEILQWQADNQVLDLDDARLALQQVGAMNQDVESYLG